MTQEGTLYEKLEGEKVRCFSCGHRCVIPEGRIGICKVRFNKGGKLQVPFGYVGALQCDPIEKKPFFHAMPGTEAFSFGMLGCDYHCPNCQNWLTSQALRDPKAIAPPQKVTPKELVAMARERGASTLASTYNEPLITSEWAVAVFQEAKRAGFKTAYISNGNGTPQVINYLRPWVDLYKVDLKGFNDKHYRELGGLLDPVLETIQAIHEKQFWLEVVTLIIPGFNDSDEELRQIARFLAKISKEIPWHLTAFHKDYKMRGPANTPVETLVRAARIGQEAGLHFIYAGNLPGKVGDLENSYCPSCKTLLVERVGYTILKNNLQSGCCPQCLQKIPGVWG
ncbi:MAG: AmmeMemoRadiSam system radical SAM enzyme [Deltaproteobacteria bacterium]|nr:AmmeMemoRadiSam system radical SAM enzyme [Deltaproteobacteria bacterium]